MPQVAIDNGRFLLYSSIINGDKAMASITASLLKLIIADQLEEKIIPNDYHHRTAEAKLEQLVQNKEITVLTGIRRCGKSVLLHTIRQKLKQTARGWCCDLN